MVLYIAEKAVSEILHRKFCKRYDLQKYNTMISLVKVHNFGPHRSTDSEYSVKVCSTIGFLSEEIVWRQRRTRSRYTAILIAPTCYPQKTVNAFQSFSYIRVHIHHYTRFCRHARLGFHFSTSFVARFCRGSSGCTSNLQPPREYFSYPAAR